MSDISLMPEDCEVYACAQEAEERGHMEAAKAAVERARRCRAAALRWRLMGERLRAESAGPLDHQNDVREPHPNAEAAQAGAS